MKKSREQPSTSTEDCQRHHGVDRRKRPTPLFNKYFLWGRRRGSRRDDDTNTGYVDRPRKGAIIWLTILIVLGVADIFLTDYELRNGLAIEGNPFMNSLLVMLGSHTAWMVKIIATIIGGWLLLAHSQWRAGFVGLMMLNIYYFWIYLIHVVVLYGLI